MATFARRLRSVFYSKKKEARIRGGKMRSSFSLTSCCGGTTGHRKRDHVSEIRRLHWRAWNEFIGKYPRTSCSLREP